MGGRWCTFCTIFHILTAERKQRDLKRDARLRRPAKLRHRLVQTRDHRHDLRLREKRLLLFERSSSVVREIERCKSARRLVDHEAAQMKRQFRQELHRIFAEREKLRDRFQDLALRALADRLRQAIDRLMPDEAEVLLDACRRQCIAVQARALVKQRQRVPHAAVRLPRDEAKRLLLARDLHLLRHIGESRFDLLDRDAPKVEALAARLDRCRHLVRLCRREDEDDMCRRLFERLQKRIKCLRRQHVHFVDDVDLVAPFGGRELHLLAQVPHLVDAAVRRRVDLKDVERRAVGDLRAIFADAARFGRRPLLTIQRLREDFRRARLARAARAGKEVGMGDASCGNRMGKRPRYGRLPHEILEAPRPPLAVERDVRHIFPP